MNPATAAGAGIGTVILPGPGTVVGAIIGTGVGIWIGYELTKPSAPKLDPYQAANWANNFMANLGRGVGGSDAANAAKVVGGAIGAAAAKASSAPRCGCK